MSPILRPFRYREWLCSCLCLLFSHHLGAATYVNRNLDAQGIERIQPVEISEETIWDRDGSPYVVERNLGVAEGVTLRISPQVVVQFKSRMEVHGVLNAQGVTFQGVDDGGWLGIYFGPSAGESRVEGCVIEGTAGDMGFYSAQWVRASIFLDGCSPVVRSNNIQPADGHGLVARHSNVIIQDNAFQIASAGRYPIWLETGDSFPVMHGNSVSGKGIHGVGLPGNLIVPESGRWSKAGEGFPYLPVGDVTVPVDVSLDIDPGVTIQNTGSWMVQGTLNVEGNPDAPVVFRGPWKGMYFAKTSGASSLEHCEIRQAGVGDLGFLNGSWRKTAVYVDATAPVFEQVTIEGSAGVGIEFFSSAATFSGGAIRNCQSHGVVAFGGESPRLVNTELALNGASGSYTVWAEAQSVPDPVGIVLKDNYLQGIQINGGELTSDRTYKRWGIAAPYVVTRDVSVAKGATLTLEPGSVLKFGGAKLWVEGTLVADGGEAGITFTSANDDTVGGDSNGDGEESVPAAGAWKGIYLGPESGGSVIRNCDLRFAGQNSLGFLQSVWRKTTVYVDQSAPVVSSNRFQDSLGNGVDLYKSMAEVTDNVFRRMGETGYPIAVNSLDLFPVMGGNQAFESPQSGVSIRSGEIIHAARWRNPGLEMPYLTAGSLTIAKDASLVVDAGTSISSIGNWMINGTLQVEGTPDALVRMGGRWNGIYFSPTAGASRLAHCEILDVQAVDLGFIRGGWRKTAIFVDSSSPRFDFVTVRDAGMNGIEFFASNAVLNRVMIEACAGHGLIAQAASRPRLNQVELIGNGVTGRYAVWTDANSVPNPEGTILRDNHQQGIEIGGGVIGEDTIWENWGGAVPYVITRDVSVSPDARLQIDPGVVTKLAGTRIWVDGTLIADGEAESIHLTSALDDSVGGDSNGDGAQSSPAPGDWIGIYLGANSSDSFIRAVEFRFGGKGELGFIHGSWRRTTLYLDQSHTSLLGSRIRDSLGSGLELYSSRATIEGNLFENMGEGRFPIVFHDLNNSPQLADNEAVGSGNLAISVGPGQVTASGVWMKPGQDFPYWPQGNLTIAPNIALTIEPGVRVEMANTMIGVEGTLLAHGTAESNIRFEGRPNGSEISNWVGILYGPESGNSRMDYTVVSQAGGSDIGFLNGGWRRTAIYVDQSSPEFHHTIVVSSLGEGIRLANSEATLQNSLIANCAQNGLAISGEKVPHLLNNTIASNRGNGISNQHGAMELVNTISAFNQGRGLALSTDSHFDASMVRHNLFHGNDAGDEVAWVRLDRGGESGNLDADPMFVDRDNGDYRLRGGSPAVDSGYGDKVFGLDLDGRIRWHGDGIDLGPYEQNAPPVKYGGDLSVRLEGEETWIGIGEGSPLEQRIDTYSISGQTWTYEMRFEYTGNAFDQIRLFGNEVPGTWKTVVSLVGGMH